MMFRLYIVEGKRKTERETDTGDEDSRGQEKTETGRTKENFSENTNVIKGVILGGTVPEVELV